MLAVGQGALERGRADREGVRVERAELVAPRSGRKHATLLARERIAQGHERGDAGGEVRVSISRACRSQVSLSCATSATRARASCSAPSVSGPLPGLCFSSSAPSISAASASLPRPVLAELAIALVRVVDAAQLVGAHLIELEPEAADG